MGRIFGRFFGRIFGRISGRIFGRIFFLLNQAPVIPFTPVIIYTVIYIPFTQRNLATLLEREHYAVYDQMTVMADLANDTMNQSSISSLPAISERNLSMSVPPKASDRIDSFDFAKPEKREAGDGCDAGETVPLDETGTSLDVSGSIFQPSEVTDKQLKLVTISH